MPSSRDARVAQAEALRADLGSRGNRGPFSEYFLPQVGWRQSISSWGLESRVRHACLEAPEDCLCEETQAAGLALAGSNNTHLPLPGFLGLGQSIHCGLERVWSQAEPGKQPKAFQSAASCLFSQLFLQPGYSSEQKNLFV